MLTEFLFNNSAFHKLIRTRMNAGDNSIVKDDFIIYPSKFSIYNIIGPSKARHFWNIALTRGSQSFYFIMQNKKNDRKAGNHIFTMDNHNRKIHLRCCKLHSIYHNDYTITVSFCWLPLTPYLYHKTPIQPILQNERKLIWIHCFCNCFN